MARFQYRLQKVFELRERKKKEQEQRVADAQQKVRQIEQQIEDKKQEIRMARQNMMSGPHIHMATADRFIHHLHGELEYLYDDLALAQNELAHERELLIKAQAELEALVKHKEKVYEEWMEEQKKLEMKQLDEVASQRYFRNVMEHEDEEFPSGWE